jgi:hypothetical protein
MLRNLRESEDATVPDHRWGGTIEFRHAVLEEREPLRMLGVGDLRVRDHVVERPQRIGGAPTNHRFRPNRKDEPCRSDGAQRTGQDRFQSKLEQPNCKPVVRACEQDGK